MATASCLLLLDDVERQAFLAIVPDDHFLCRLLQAVDFESFRPILESAYQGFGRPPVDCIVMLKLELLARQHRYSDREVIAAARFNMAYRLFLGISFKSPLPHPTSLTYFRQRLGPQRLQDVFDNLVGQARRLGLVKDRLRLKDATHVIANIAVPSTIRLVAETRDHLLDALRPFAAERVAEEEEQADILRQAMEEVKDEERLLRRVTHLRALVAWAETLPSEVRQTARVEAALTLAHKILADRDDPRGGDQVRSVQDPEARCGKHGKFYDGYLLDVAMDADSELLTAVNILPANGDEGRDAAQLIRQEEQAQGNDVQALSIDGAGYRGDVLRELTQELQVEVFVPTPQRIPLTVFGPEAFTLSAAGTTLTCPAGQTTTQWERTAKATGRKFRFAKKHCDACPRRGECLANPQTQRRSVIKNDYEAEYQAAQAKAQTEAYAATRKEHPAIERKLAELVNRHALRHARYRGRSKVLWQALLTGLVVNVKRIVRLLDQAMSSAQSSAGKLRAVAVGGA